MTICLCHGGMCEPSIRCSWPCATMGLSNHRDPVGPHFSEPMFWRTRETRIQWRKGTPQFRNKILSITTDTMLHSRDVDENVLGVCVVCAIQAHVAGAWTDGRVQPRRPRWPVIVQRGEGCIRGSLGGCLADPKVDWWVLDSTPSLRNHLAFSRCVPCLMYKWAVHQRFMGLQMIMKRRLYPGCTPLCPHPQALPHTVPLFCFYAGVTWFFNCLWKCGMSLLTLFTQRY